MWISMMEYYGTRLDTLCYWSQHVEVYFQQSIKKSQVGFYPTGLDSKMLVGGQPTLSVVLEVEAEKKKKKYFKDIKYIT